MRYFDCSQLGLWLIFFDAVKSKKRKRFIVIRSFVSILAHPLEEVERPLGVLISQNIFSLVCESSEHYFPLIADPLRGSVAPPNATSRRLQLPKKQPEKLVRNEAQNSDPMPPEVVKIPDNLTVGKRKGNITSKVVKVCFIFCPRLIGPFR